MTQRTSARIAGRRARRARSWPSGPAVGVSSYLVRFLSVALILLVAANFSNAWAQSSSWELRVCVPASEPPASDQTHPGYEEKVASILAHELGADLKLVYAPGGGNGYAVQHELAPGNCDLIMGAPEGAQGLVNTVPYLRLPYVFVTQSSATFSIKGLGDPVLKKLKVAVPPNSLMASAMQDAGLASSIVPVSPNYTVGGAPSMEPLIEEVQNGAVDVAMVYGPYASYYVQQPSRHLKMTIVSPEITLAGYPMFHIETIGVRPGDDSLQRELNDALAAGWTQIQAVMKATGVPMLSVTQPIASPAPNPRPLVIGVVLPIPSGLPAITDKGAAAADAGGSLANRLVGRSYAASGRDLRVRFASSPTAAVADRAARRLVLTDHVSALVGGMGSGQADALARVASQLGVPFLNIADASASARATCSADVFHVAASASMYLDALARWSVASRHDRWFVVAGGPDAQTMVSAARQALVKAGGGDVVGDVQVAAKANVYYNVFDTIDKASPSLVVLAMDPVQQGLFLSQLPTKDARLAVAGLLPTYAQDRYTFTELTQDNPKLASDFRPVMWDPTIDTKVASGLSEAFGAQAGTAIDSGAWATYMAIKIVADASSATHSIEPATIAAYLADPSHTFDLDKGVPLSFRPWNHQLRQPLYIARLNPTATWGPDPGAQAALASVTATVPSGLGAGGDAAHQLDALGVGATTSRCR